MHHRGRSAARGCVIFGRYRVGARSEREAMVLLRRVVGKHSKVNVYFEVREEERLLPYGVVIQDC